MTSSRCFVQQTCKQSTIDHPRISGDLRYACGMRWILVPLLLTIPLSLPACAKQPEPPPAPAIAAGSARLSDSDRAPASVQAALVAAVPASAVPAPAQGAF